MYTVTDHRPALVRHTRMLSPALTFCSVLLFATFSACDAMGPGDDSVDYREEMRSFIVSLSDYAKAANGDFLIVPQNGQEIMTSTGEGSGQPYAAYLAAIDATGRESLFYGYDGDDQETPDEAMQHMLDLCLVSEQHGVEVLVTDYCFTQTKMDNSYTTNEGHDFISFAAEERSLTTIPGYPNAPYNENASHIDDVGQAKNFLYLINSEAYASKQDLIDAIAGTNYDLIVVDLFHNETSYTANEIAQLKTKNNDGRRLVICYMSIGEAEDYRYYWQAAWNSYPPDWLEPENPDWPGNYKVRYWEPEWQEIIYGSDDSYLDRILDAGFDGVYLDIVDGFEYFEENQES